MIWVAKRLRWKALSLLPSERRYGLALGAALLFVGAGYASYQLWLGYSPDFGRAIAWLGGKQDLGTSRLQRPILRQGSFPKIASQQRGLASAVDEAVEGLNLDDLPVKNQLLRIQFAGVDLPSNNALANYLLLRLKAKLLEGQASAVRVAYPKTTFRLAESAVTNGVPLELDAALMSTADQELVSLSEKERGVWRELLVAVREAGVDTEDRSIYSLDFYARVALVACLSVFAIGVIAYAVLNRRWPDRSRLNALVATVLAVLGGWNVVMYLFAVLRPNMQRFNVVSRVDLVASVRLGDQFYQRRAKGLHEVLVGVDLVQYLPDQPTLLGRPKILAPMEGGYAPLIPPPP